MPPNSPPERQLTSRGRCSCVDAATAEALELFSVEALQRPPLGDVVIDYFVDATRSGHLCPTAARGSATSCGT